jgi:hypothetical protein
MNWNGIIVGAYTFALIGVLHRAVVATERKFGSKPWTLYMLAGLVCIAMSLFSAAVVDAMLAVTGFSLLWSVRELFEQKERAASSGYRSRTRTFARARDRDGADKTV